MSINANNAALNEILEAINELPSSKEEQEKSINITENGETVVTPDDENTTLSKVTVNVEVPTKEEQSKTIDITENGTIIVAPDDGVVWSEVTVNTAVESGGGNIGVVEEKDVTFIDYDGTFVASYTLEEAMALTELPPAPNHEDIGLTFQEWNWTLDDIKDNALPAIVGAHYKTTDGKTRIYFTLDNEDYLSPAINFVQSIPNGVVIDWGDGSETQTHEGTLYSGGSGEIFHVKYYEVKVQHTYPSVGNYVITLDCIDGTFGFVGNSNQSGGYLRDVLVSPERGYFGNAVYFDSITKIELSDNCVGIHCNSINLKSCNFPNSLIQYSTTNNSCIIVSSNCKVWTVNGISNCEVISFPYTEISSIYALGFRKLSRVFLNNKIVNTKASFKNSKIEKVIIPSNYNTTCSECFNSCYWLRKVEGFENVTNIGVNSFLYCDSLQHINLSENLVTIPTNTFYACYSLKKINIPQSVTSIGQSAFGNSGLVSVIIPSNVTNLGNNAFGQCSNMEHVKIESASVTFGNSVFYFNAANASIKRYYDFTKATVTDGVLSYTFGTDVFKNIKAGTVIMFATKEIADVAKETTNLTAYADYIHYLGEEEATE